MVQRHPARSPAAVAHRTANHPQGSVSGLTRTTACTQPGDSG
jgi:hypothetical protein